MFWEISGVMTHILVVTWILLSMVNLLSVFQIISLNTTLVLNDKNFEDVERSTLLAILDCDKLNISSELELLTAVYRWAVQECSRQGNEGYKLYVRLVYSFEYWHNYKYVSLILQFLNSIVSTVQWSRCGPFFRFT